MPVEPDFQAYMEKWVIGIDGEIRFWSEWLQSKGGQWPEDYARRTGFTPTLLDDDIALCITNHPTWPPKVLDVGSGPISKMGITTQRGDIELSACDPLADFYEVLLESAGVQPYVKTDFAYSEALTDVYEREQFDFVCVTNALDHAFYPLASIEQMLAVVKVGGTVCLMHYENEAERENYSGFHQWNITEDQGRLLIWRGEQKSYVDEIFGGSIKISAKRYADAEPHRIFCKILKVAPIPIQSNKKKCNLDRILLSLLKTYFVNENSEKR